MKLEIRLLLGISMVISTIFFLVGFRPEYSKDGTHINEKADQI